MTGLGYFAVQPGARATNRAGHALVVGEATYASLPPLPGYPLSAQAVATALRGLGFAVDELNDVSSSALYAAIGTPTRQRAALPQTPAFVYLCGYEAIFDGQPCLLPVSPSIGRPADTPTQGLLARTLLNAAAGDGSVPGILALDTMPMPNGAAAVPLNALLQPELPPTFAYIAIIIPSSGSTPAVVSSMLGVKQSTSLSRSG